MGNHWGVYYRISTFSRVIKYVDKVIINTVSSTDYEEKLFTEKKIQVGTELFSFVVTTFAHFWS